MRMAQTDEQEVINFLLTTEIIPLCLKIMESGSELSKTVRTYSSSSPYQCLVLFQIILYLHIVIYVAAKATYIRLLHGKIGFLGGFFGP